MVNFSSVPISSRMEKNRTCCDSKCAIYSLIVFPLMVVGFVLYLHIYVYEPTKIGIDNNIPEIQNFFKTLATKLLEPQPNKPVPSYNSHNTYFICVFCGTSTSDDPSPDSVDQPSTSKPMPIAEPSKTVSTISKKQKPDPRPSSGSDMDSSEEYENSDNESSEEDVKFVDEKDARSNDQSIKEKEKLLKVHYERDQKQLFKEVEVINPNTTRSQNTIPTIGAEGCEICYLKKCSWLKTCDDDSETSNWIAANTKACLKDFHSSDESEVKTPRDAQEKSRAALQRYLFYCNRYMNHIQSLKFEHKLYASVKEKMEEIQQHNMSWIEVQFLNKTSGIVCQYHQTLMYTYVFAFYLVKSNQSVIFEDNQRDLESATEKLFEYLERDITSENLADVKEKVQDKYRYSESRRKVLLEHVYEGYDKDWWVYLEC